MRSGRPPPADEPSLFQPAEADALRRRAPWAALLIASTSLLPVETANDGARWLPGLLADLHRSSAWVLLAPALAAGVVVIAARRCRRADSLALVVLAALAALALMAAPARAVLAGDLLLAPPWLAGGLGPGLAAVGLAVAGAHLAGRPSARRAARACFLAAAVATLAHLAVPFGGEAPRSLLARVVPHVAAHSGPGNLLGVVVLAVVLVWPIPATAAVWARSRRPGERSILGPALAYGAPLPLAPLVVPVLAGGPWAASAAEVAAGFAGTLAALVLLAGAVVVVAEADPGELVGGRSGAPRLLAAAAAPILAAVGTWAAARPTGDAPVWRLGPPSPAAERLFGASLPAWNDRAVRRRDLAAAEREIEGRARELDAGLGEALAAFVRASTRADLTELGWYRLTAGVNEAARRAALPYYVDPTARIVGEQRRWHRIDTYRIERVSRVRAGGRTVAALQVRALAPERGRLAALGFSRDLQPFAVVVLDEIAAYAAELSALSARGQCREPTPAGAEPEGLSRTCGELLASAARAGDLGAALLALTLRHEVQHQLDGLGMPDAPWVASRLAWAPIDHRRRVQRELSAYLAQMGAASPAASLTVVRLLRLSQLGQGVERDTAALALEALGGALPGGEDALRERGRRAYRQVFGEDPAEVTETGP